MCWAWRLVHQWAVATELTEHEHVINAKTSIALTKHIESCSALTFGVGDLVGSPDGKGVGFYERVIFEGKTLVHRYKSSDKQLKSNTNNALTKRVGFLVGVEEGKDVAGLGGGVRI